MLARDELIAHIPRLRRYARALTGDGSRADDLVQDSLERALSRFTLWPPRDLRPWLFSIMHNLFVNQVRRPNPIEYREDPGEHDYRAQPMDRLELRDMDAALQRLPQEQREVLLLVALEELPYAEVARVLGIPQGTVMSRLSRGRDRLRDLLAVPDAPSHLKVVK
jgi:RNA polymerase sigma-70 factor (ECF subfamily)